MGDVVAFGARRLGKTALMWHQLRAASRAAGLPIECVVCERQHDTPPALGRCVCGSYGFGVKSATAAQPSLPLGV